MAEPTSPVQRREPRWLAPAVASALGLFYAYAVWNAVGFLVAQASAASGLNGAGWALLLFAVAFPMIVFASAATIARRLAAWRFGLVLLTGLGLVAVFWLNILAYAFTSGDVLIGS